MANPLDTNMISEIEDLTKCRVASFIATKTEIDEAISKWYKQKE